MFIILRHQQQPAFCLISSLAISLWFCTSGMIGVVFFCSTKFRIELEIS